MKLTRQKLKQIIREEISNAPDEEMIELSEHEPVEPELDVLAEGTELVLGYVPEVLHSFPRAGGLRNQVSDAILSTVALIDRDLTDDLIAKLDELGPEFFDPSQSTTRE